MISKSYVFGGGLLVNTIAIFASISSDVVAKEEDLYRVRSELNQIYWCICWHNIGNVIQVTNQYENDEWILNDKYQDSRTNVIGKAIGDCVAGNGVFAGRNAADIITFAGTRPENYLQQHWNAVILYNYINEALNVTGKIDKDNYIAKIANVLNVLNNTYEVNNNNQSKIDMIKEQYRNYFKQQYNNSENSEQLSKFIAKANKQIDKAVKDIQAYVDALCLNSCLWHFYCAKVNYSLEQKRHSLDSLEQKRHSLAPGLSNVWNMSESGKMDSGWEIDFSAMFSTITKYNKLSNTFIERTVYIPTFRLQNGKLYLAGLFEGKDHWISAEKGGHWEEQEEPSLINDLESLKQYEWILDLLKDIVALPRQEQLDTWNAEPVAA